MNEKNEYFNININNINSSAATSAGSISACSIGMSWLLQGKKEVVVVLEGINITFQKN